MTARPPDLTRGRRRFAALPTLCAAVLTLLASSACTGGPRTVTDKADRKVEWSRDPAIAAAIVAAALGTVARPDPEHPDRVVVMSGERFLISYGSDVPRSDGPIEIEVADLDVVLGGLASTDVDYQIDDGPPRSLSFTDPDGRRTVFAEATR